MEAEADSNCNGISVEVEGGDVSETKEGLENFEYVEFYKSQLAQIKAENERLKEAHALAQSECKAVKANCKALVERICKDSNFLREKLASAALVHNKGTWAPQPWRRLRGRRRGLRCAAERG